MSSGTDLDRFRRCICNENFMRCIFPARNIGLVIPSHSVKSLKHHVRRSGIPCCSSIDKVPICLLLQIIHESRVNEVSIGITETIVHHRPRQHGQVERSSLTMVLNGALELRCRGANSWLLLNYPPVFCQVIDYLQIICPYGFGQALF